MCKTLRVTVLTGPHKDHKFCFRGFDPLVIGRATDCAVQLSGTERDCAISRHHCRLNLDSSSLTIQDLGSRNGTYLNGARIDYVDLPLMEGADTAGRCSCAEEPCEGQLLTLGGTTLRVEMVECPPRHLVAAEEPPLWQPNETAKRDCPVQCLK
jgi:hypothetical protein